jgi:hypothetical protein
MAASAAGGQRRLAKSRRVEGPGRVHGRTILEVVGGAMLFGDAKDWVEDSRRVPRRRRPSTMFAAVISICSVRFGAMLIAGAS